MTASEKIKRILPLSFPWKTSDPFLFCAHHEDYYPAGNDIMGPVSGLEGRSIGNDFVIKDGFRMYHGNRVPGFPSHPHCGFETVTIALQGFVDHSDSLGAAGRFGKGDVQWMTAGKGVQHCEMFPLISKDSPNTLEIFQIWLNLPMKGKKVDAHFAMIWSEDIPIIQTKDKAGKSVQVRVVAGELDGIRPPSPPPHSWASDKSNEVAIWMIRMEAGAEWVLPAASPGLSRTLYFHKGEEIKIEDSQVRKYHSIEIESDSSIRIANGNSTSELLLLQGRPLGEPVVQYGPFVVNFEHEIREKLIEFQRNQFGGWPWPSNDNVHERSKGRFARYADGMVEERSASSEVFDGKLTK